MDTFSERQHMNRRSSSASSSNNERISNADAHGDMFNIHQKQEGNAAGRGSEMHAAAPSHISLKVSDQNQNEVEFNARTTKSLGKLMRVYCERQGKAADSYHFSYKRSRITGDDTPESLNMKDGDQIQALPPHLESEDSEVPENTNAGDPTAHMTIIVRDQASKDIVFRVKPSTRIKKIVDAYCKREQMNPEVCRFLFEGEKFTWDETPESLGMGDNDRLDVFLEQRGGYMKASL